MVFYVSKSDGVLRPVNHYGYVRAMKKEEQQLKAHLTVSTARLEDEVH